MDDIRSVRKGTLALDPSIDDLLNDIEVPSLDVPDLDASFCSAAPAKDLFAEKKRKH